MSKRLQVLLPEPEMAEIRELAERERVTVGDCVRCALRVARAQRLASDAQSKLKSVGQMLAEIKRGYEG